MMTTTTTTIGSRLPTDGPPHFVPLLPVPYSFYYHSQTAFSNNVIYILQVLPPFFFSLCDRASRQGWFSFFFLPIFFLVSFIIGIIIIILQILHIMYLIFFFFSFFFTLLVDGQVSISLSKVFEGGGKTFPVLFMFSSTFFFYFFFSLPFCYSFA